MNKESSELGLFGQNSSNLASRELDAAIMATSEKIRQLLKSSLKNQDVERNESCPQRPVKKLKRA